MITISNLDFEQEQILLNKLWNGEWKNKDINLNLYLQEYKFKHLLALSAGCRNNQNYDILLMLYTIIRNFIHHPNAHQITSRTELIQIIKNSGMYPDMEQISNHELAKFLNERIVAEAINIMREIIISAETLKYQAPICQTIIDECSKSKLPTIRLYVACTTDNPSIFLNDSDERVRKIAFTRSEFALKLKHISQKEYSQLVFLTSAIKTKIINLFDGLTNITPDNYISVRFQSLLFEESPYIQFDADIFYNIIDDMLLANEINKLLHEGKIKFASTIAPSYFDDIADTIRLNK